VSNGIGALAKSPHPYPLPQAQEREQIGMIHVEPRFAAMLWMLLAAFCSQCVNVGIRYLAGSVHPFEIVFFRAFFGLLLFIPWIMRSGLAGMRTERPLLHLGRGTLQVVSMFMFFTAVTMIPIADAAALSLATPVVVVLGAIVMLGERAGFDRWLAVAAGLAGALVVLRPGVAPLNWGAILVLLSVFAAAEIRITAKILLRTDSPSALVCYLTLVVAPLALVGAVFFWTWPTLTELAVMAAMGGFATTAHLALAKAYQHADISLLEPLSFTMLIWAAALGYIAFGEEPSIWTWAGGAIIVAAASWLAREAGRRPRGAGAAGIGTRA
jgi:drug/metabolite transporter (DMT)-like permease